MQMRVILILALVTVGISACGQSGGSTSDGRPVVVATTTQLADLAREIGGPDVDVHQLLQPNSDPHEYEPRPKDVATAARARLILTSGLGLDAWMPAVLSASGTKARVVDVGASVPTQLPGTGDESGSADPHWWHDPLNMRAATTTVEQALSAASPAAAPRIAARAQSYRLRLTRLDARIRACFDRIPAAQRKLVTDHDAFAYFVRRYGLRYIGAVIPAQTTQAQASAGEVAQLEDTIRREHVSAVFPESSVNKRLARRIAQDTGATVGGTLYGDTLGRKDGPGGTYIGMEEANADAMLRGMTGGRAGCPAGA
jgi:zinc/manganese transport system substrate-binding protein